MPHVPELPSGERVYAIGDIHGRLDLFERLIAMIRHDNAARAPAIVRIVLLGDIIDRGPSSAQLVARCRAMAARSDRFIVLKGNHEALMVDAMRGSFPALQLWMKHGGEAALRSWGVREELLALGPAAGLLTNARLHVTAGDIAWLDALPLTYQAGNILFVHAGIRPGVKLAKQDPRDLLWIRRDFTAHEGELPLIVVHGHSEHEMTPELRHDRIGIDTGGYRTGRLTALGLEDGACWTIATDPADADPAWRDRVDAA